MGSQGTQLDQSLLQLLLALSQRLRRPCALGDFCGELRVELFHLSLPGSQGGDHLTVFQSQMQGHENRLVQLPRDEHHEDHVECHHPSHGGGESTPLCEKTDCNRKQGGDRETQERCHHG